MISDLAMMGNGGLAPGDLPDEQRTSRSYAAVVRQTLKHHYVNGLAITDAMRAEWVRIVVEFMASENPKRQKAGASMLMEGQKYNLALAKTEIDAMAPQQQAIVNVQFVKVIKGVDPEAL